MATTPEYGIRYPSGGDDVDIATSLQNLALDVEGAMNDNLLPATGGTLTGPITVPYGNTGGIHIGGSGPQILSGTGSPEGAVTAPPGSTFTQTNATNDVKGWIRWNKATGTGSSGWVVGPEYDTGWRDMTAVALLNGWTAGSRLQLRRLGNTVRYNGFVNAAAATNRIFYFLPAGFRPANWEYLTVLYGTTIVKALETYLDGQMSIYSYGPGDHYISTSWLTTNAAPATLPGTL